MKGKKQQDQALEALENKAQKETVYNEFLTVKQISSYLAFKVSTLYTMVEEKQIPHYRIGRQIRFRKADVDQWMAERKEEIINIRVEANKIFKSTEKKGDMDVNTIVKKTIDDKRGRRYTSGYGKPDQVKGLRKEVQDGTL